MNIKKWETKVRENNDYREIVTQPYSSKLINKLGINGLTLKIKFNRDSFFIKKNMPKNIDWDSLNYFIFEFILDFKINCRFFRLQNIFIKIYRMF